MKTQALRSMMIGAAIMLTAAGSAKAISYTLDTGNSAISGYTGPYGTVDVGLNTDGTATITFTANNNVDYQYLFGGQGAVAVNVNATSFTLDSVVETTVGTGFTAGTGAEAPTNGGTKNEDGFGKFNLTIDNFDGLSHSVGTVILTLSNNSGTWATADDVLTPNANDGTVAAHIFVTDYPANAKVDALTTGYAGNGQEIPDGGSTALLLGAALIGFGFFRRKCLCA